MTYKLESFIGKIESPIICVIDGTETFYENGQDLLKQEFEKIYMVSAVRHAWNGIVIQLEENKRINDTSWAGQEEVSFT